MIINELAECERVRERELEMFAGRSLGVGSARSGAATGAAAHGPTTASDAVDGCTAAAALTCCGVTLLMLKRNWKGGGEGAAAEVAPAEGLENTAAVDEATADGEVASGSPVAAAAGEASGVRATTTPTCAGPDDTKKGTPAATGDGAWGSPAAEGDASSVGEEEPWPLRPSAWKIGWCASMDREEGEIDATAALALGAAGRSDRCAPAALASVTSVSVRRSGGPELRRVTDAAAVALTAFAFCM